MVFAKIIDENEDERKRKPNPDWQNVAVIIKIDIMSLMISRGAFPWPGKFKCKLFLACHLPISVSLIERFLCVFQCFVAYLACCSQAYKVTTLSLKKKKTSFGMLLYPSKNSFRHASLSLKHLASKACKISFQTLPLGLFLCSHLTCSHVIVVSPPSFPNCGLSLHWQDFLRMIGKFNVYGTFQKCMTPFCFLA